jgi:hypothetical protein
MNDSAAYAKLQGMRARARVAGAASGKQSVTSVGEWAGFQFATEWQG